jgi:RNA polymerase sigma factor (sigma-70 family)
VPVEELEPVAAGNASGRADRDDGLWDAVHALPDKQRGAVLLRFVGDLSHREIAAALGSSEEAARRSLADGLAKLRTEWTPA